LLLAAGLLSVSRWLFPGLEISNPEPLWLLVVRTVCVTLIVLAALLPNSPKEQERDERHVILGISLRVYAVALTLLMAWAWYGRLSA
tara:strand:- start:525 stop:785 length:261 start_codon:yes stop_codon:yes gene_type:complete